MDKKTKLERKIVHKIIHSVHNESVRISDGGQRQLHILIRQRMLDSNVIREVEFDIDKDNLAGFIEEFSGKIHEEIPKKSASSNDPRYVVRPSFLEKILHIFDDVWPFSGG
jgi:hypothetical protein